MKTYHLSSSHNYASTTFQHILAKQLLCVRYGVGSYPVPAFTEPTVYWGVG